jgi:hypothetical protein
VTFGIVESTGSKYASTTGSVSEVEAHSISAQTNSNNGYFITVKGDTLTRDSFSIDAIGGTNTAPSPGTEQFGLRGVVTTGTGLISAPYAASGFAYDATASSADIVATGDGDRVTTEFSIRYLVDISTTTVSGLYTANLQYVVTPTF